MTGKEELPYKITYSKEAKEYIEKQKIEEYLDDFQEFFPKKMINIYHKSFNDFIIGKMGATIELRNDVQIDERLLNKWVDMCIKLDNMSKEQIEDIAIRHYIEKLEKRKDKEITKYKRAFEILKDKGVCVLNEKLYVDFEEYDENDLGFETGYYSYLAKEEYELLEELMKSEDNQEN